MEFVGTSEIIALVLKPTGEFIDPLYEGYFFLKGIKVKLINLL